MKIIKETTLHPEGNDGVDLYPKTSITQIENLPNVLARIDQTEQNLVVNKLDKPANPSAESAVTMLVDGTVGTKPLSKIGGGGGKLYLHKISIVEETTASTYTFYLYNRISTKMTLNDIAGRYFVASITGGMYKGTVSCIIEPSTTEGSTHKLKVNGVVTYTDNNPKVLKVVEESNGIMFSDAVTEL